VPAKRPGSNRTAASRVSLVGPNEPKPIVCCGVDEGIPSRKGAERQRTTRRAHQGRRKKGRRRKRKLRAWSPLLRLSCPAPPHSLLLPHTTTAFPSRPVCSFALPPMHSKLSRAAHRLLCCGGAAAGEDR
jgi:hypothetical protein